jgi:hypothetical protein
MPSGRKDIYGAPSRRLADPKVIKAEMGAQRNAAIPARERNSDREIAKLMAREGTTNASGGRPATKMPAKAAPAKAPKPQVIRTTVLMKPTPTKKK